MLLFAFFGVWELLRAGPKPKRVNGDQDFSASPAPRWLGGRHGPTLSPRLSRRVFSRRMCSVFLTALLGTLSRDTNFWQSQAD
jgi:hypothetical protein